MKRSLVSSPLLVQIVQNFFTAGFDSSQPRCWQNIFQPDLHKHHDSYVYCVIVYPLEKWFATYFELALGTKLCAISLFWSWLVIDKFQNFVSFSFLGGLGSCSHTVNALQIKTIGGGARGGHCLIFSWTGPSLRLKFTTDRHLVGNENM